MSDRRKKRNPGTAKQRPAGNISLSYPLNPRYCFDNFVVGSSNQFAYEAALAVANKPADIYNPLLICGSGGLGTSHLLLAIGNHVLARNKNARICYCTSERFVNVLIHSLRYNRIEQFSDYFRGLDILLLDDVQFLAGKERSQDEFFHVFNTLYESRKQIVITSDRIPKHMEYLEEKLRSRLEAGLYAVIQPPDIETMLAVIKKKAELCRIDLPDDVAHLLVSGNPRNIREVEGRLIRLDACSNLLNIPIAMEMAKESLREVLIDYADPRKPHTRVGIYWSIDGVIICDAVPQEDAEAYGEALQYGAHYEFWEKLVPRTETERKFKAHAYDYYPRGRMVLFPQRRTVRLYVDRCMDNDTINAALDFFAHREYQIEIENDEHYRCSGCNPNFME